MPAGIQYARFWQEEQRRFGEISDLALAHQKVAHIMLCNTFGGLDLRIHLYLYIIIFQLFMFLSDNR